MFADKNAAGVFSGNDVKCILWVYDGDSLEAFPRTRQDEVYNYISVIMFNNKDVNNVD